MEPPEPIEHFGIPGEWMNQLREYCISIRPINGPGLLANQGSNGIMLETVGGRGRGGTNGTHPFKGLLLSNTGGLLTFRVVYGTVLGTPPDQMSTGDSPNYIFTTKLKEGVAYIRLVITDSTQNIEKKEIKFTETLPNDSMAETEPTEAEEGTSVVHRQLFNWVTEGNGNVKIAQDVIGSQWFELCAGTIPQWGLT